MAGRGQVGPSGRDAAKRRLDDARKVLDTTVLPRPVLRPSLIEDAPTGGKPPVAEPRPPVREPDRTDVHADGFSPPGDHSVDLGSMPPARFREEAPGVAPGPAEPPRAAYSELGDVLDFAPSERDPAFVEKPPIPKVSAIQTWVEGVFVRANFSNDKYQAAIVAFSEAAKKAGYSEDLVRLALETSIRFYHQDGRLFADNSNLFNINKPHKFNDKYLRQLKTFGTARAESAVELLKQKLGETESSETNIRYYLPRFSAVVLEASTTRNFKHTDKQVIDWLVCNGRTQNGFSSVMNKNNKRIVRAIAESLKPKPEPKKVEPPKMGEKTYPHSFGLPGSKRRLASGCYLEYKGAKDGQYEFVLHQKGAKPDLFRLVITEQYSKQVTIKGVKADVEITLNSHNGKSGNKLVSVKMETQQKILDSISRGGIAEMWSNLRLKPYTFEIATATVCFGADAALFLTSTGSDLLGTFYQPALVALAAVQAGLLLFSRGTRNTNLNKEAASLEVKS
ncbi:MAG: hypothetical protein ABH842_02485 [Candidatus Micrarchaeota archaeon]